MLQVWRCIATLGHFKCAAAVDNELHDSGVRRAAVLIVDDDPGTRDTFSCALTAHGLTVATAASAAEALAQTERQHFDVIVVDVRLPDMLGTDLARTLHQQLPNVRLLIVSGFLTTRTTVEAVKNGAIDVLEKPVDVDRLISTITAALHNGAVSRLPTDARNAALAAMTPAGAPRSRSAAERWAMNVFRASDAAVDMRTLDDWARCVGLSYSSLRESCRLLRIRPHDARDLARVLRAIVTTCGHTHLGVQFDISDMRTLKKLLDRAGLADGLSGQSVSVEDFLQRQRFVESSNEGLTALRKLLATRLSPP